MKITKIVLFLLLLSLSIFAQSKKDDIDSIKPHWDKTSKTKIYIPKDLDECFVELKNMLHPTFIEKYKNGEIPAIDQHFGLGLWMRNNWGLWAGERLAKYFNAMGIFHPDDMSSIILESYRLHLNGKPLELEKQIQGYKDYWEAAKTPKGDEAIFAQCPKGVEIKGQLFYDQKEGEKYRVTHFGYCTSDKKLWVFERGKGWFEPSEEMLKRINDPDSGNKSAIIGTTSKPVVYKPKTKRKSKN